VIIKNGVTLTGRIHRLTISDSPLLRKYVPKGNLRVDENLRDVGSHFLAFASKFQPMYLSLMRDNVVEGRSWEMAAAQALLGDEGIYSGTVDGYTGSRVYYGAVPAVETKRILAPHLITAYDITHRTLSR